MKPSYVIVPFLLFAITDCKKENANRRDKSRHSGRRAVREDDDATGVSDGQCELEISCKGEPKGTTGVKLPIKGPRGPPGKPGEKGMPGDPGKPGKTGDPGESAKPTPNVAFFVGLKENRGVLEQNTDLVFDQTVTNVGGAFDGETGRFTAPYDGVYSFTVVVAAQGRQKAAVMLMKEGTMVMTIWAESIPYWATSSNTAILNLRAGQRVWPVLLKRAPYIHGYMYSTFSGFLLFAASNEVNPESGDGVGLHRPIVKPSGGYNSNSTAFDNN